MHIYILDKMKESGTFFDKICWLFERNCCQIQQQTVLSLKKIKIRHNWKRNLTKYAIVSVWKKLLENSRRNCFFFRENQSWAGNLLIVVGILIFFKDITVCCWIDSNSFQTASIFCQKMYHFPSFCLKYKCATTLLCKLCTFS